VADVTAPRRFSPLSANSGHSGFPSWGAGDLTLTTGGANKETIQIPNVLLVDRKMKAIERLIAVKPDQVRVSPG
jgi:hypothetical protein